MIRYTTPSMNINLIDVDGNLLIDFVFDYLVVTIKTKDGKEINKKVMFEDVEDANFKIDFTQAETGQLNEGNPCDIQINVWYGNDRIASHIKHFPSSRNLLNRVIESYDG